MPKKDTTTKPTRIVRVTNTATGAQQDVRMPFSGHIRQLYTLWPTFTPYVIGFTLLGFSFIAHTLRLFTLFGILLASAAIVVVGTAIYRSIRRSE
jgi:hypothetical protein